MSLKMSLKSETKPEASSSRASLSFPKLLKASQELEADVSEWLATIAEINRALTEAKLRVAAWHVLASGADHNELSYWSRELGWSQVGEDWKLCIRKVSGDVNHPEDEIVETWAFEDAPRWLMLDGAAKIPDLLETLVKRTEEMRAKVQRRKADTAELAVVLKSFFRDDAESKGGVA